MSKHVQDYCDVCGGLLYHSIRGNHFKFSDRWYWRGSLDRENENDVCGDCLHAIAYVVEHNRELVAKTRRKIGDGSPKAQMEDYKPTTWRKVLNIFKSAHTNQNTIKRDKEPI